MIRLTLSDGTRIHVNPNTISYVQPLPITKSGDREQPKTKVVLMGGESLSVREAQGRILAAAGFGPTRRRKEEEPEATEHEHSDE